MGRLGLVVIGRNEGDRLARCLASVSAIPKKIYVDSGSTDGSVELAKGYGVKVVVLPVPPHFTAARARNAGLAQLLADEPDLEFVQMVDGDCELAPGWIDAALTVLRADSGVALVYGRLRERYPDRSLYNALCDDEWDMPLGESTRSGGNAMFRVAALRHANFYRAPMIAGEDTELSVRLRKLGWRMYRIIDEMGLHDAAITRFGQWWGRTRRSGHGYAEMAMLHPDSRDPDCRRSSRSIVFWGCLMPASLLVAVLLALTVDAWWWAAAALIFLPWPLRIWQITRRQRQKGLSARVARASGFLLMLGKIPQFLGLAGYHVNRLSGRDSRLIEYKGSEAA
jgi:GT2 family glycosyltransferase